MGLDIGGNLITQAGAVLTINTGASMSMLSAGGVRRPAQTQFQAIGGVTAAWVFWTTEQQWNKVPFTDVRVNTNACYSAANSRFTAPVAGSYFFQYSVYLLKDIASDSTYFHPVFAVNGAISGGTVNTSYPNYRLRGYGRPMGTYVDGQAFEVFQLAAGDYVEAYMYSNGGWNGSAGNRHYPPQERFTGFLLG